MKIIVSSQEKKDALVYDFNKLISSSTVEIYGLRKTNKYLKKKGKDKVLIFINDEKVKNDGIFFSKESPLFDLFLNPSLIEVDETHVDFKDLEDELEDELPECKGVSKE